jgi:hypothetical protein
MSKGYVTSEKERARMKEYKKNNPEKVRAWFVANREVLNARRRAKYAADEAYRKKLIQESKEQKLKNPESRLNSRLKAYGIDLSEYQRILQSQGGVCAICKRAGRELSKLYAREEIPRLVVDHCHATGNVRGLLCSRCNLGLGKFLDSPALLDAAIVYLRGDFRSASGAASLNTEASR